MIPYYPDDYTKPKGYIFTEEELRDIFTVLTWEPNLTIEEYLRRIHLDALKQTAETLQRRAQLAREELQELRDNQQ